MLLGYGVTNFLIWKKVGVQIGRFFIHVWLKAIPVIVLTMLTWVLLSNYIEVNNWLQLGMVVLLTSTIYILTIWVLYLSAEEKEIVKRIIK